MTHIWWTSSDGRIELQIPQEAIEACSHSGQCDEDVAYWMPKIDFSNVTRLDMEHVLREYGAWDDLQTVDEETLKERLTWIACGDLSDMPQEEWETV